MRLTVHHVIAGSITVALLAILATLPARHIGPEYLYPTIEGSLNPAVTQANISSTICKSGWTSTVRPPVSYTNALKKKLIANLPDKNLADYELDHAVSIELSGNPTDPNNLWMELYKTPKGVGAREKDVVETYLKNRVCDGSMTLIQAQGIIKKDWYEAYLTIEGQPVPSDTDN